MYIHSLFHSVSLSFLLLITTSQPSLIPDHSAVCIGSREAEPVLLYIIFFLQSGFFFVSCYSLPSLIPFCLAVLSRRVVDKYFVLNHTHFSLASPFPIPLFIKSQYLHSSSCQLAVSMKNILIGKYSFLHHPYFSGIDYKSHAVTPSPYAEVSITRSITAIHVVNKHPLMNGILSQSTSFLPSQL